MEEIRQSCGGLQLQNEDVYMATKFGDFIQKVVRRLRGEDEEAEMVVDYVSVSSMSNSKLLQPTVTEDACICHLHIWPLRPALVLGGGAHL